MPKFAKIERPSTPREAYELLRSSKTARVMGGGLWMRLQHRGGVSKNELVRRFGQIVR